MNLKSSLPLFLMLLLILALSACSSTPLSTENIKNSGTTITELPPVKTDAVFDDSIFALDYTDLSEQEMSAERAPIAALQETCSWLWDTRYDDHSELTYSDIAARIGAHASVYYISNQNNDNRRVYQWQAKEDEEAYLWVDFSQMYSSNQLFEWNETQNRFEDISTAFRENSDYPWILSGWGSGKLN